MDDVEELERKMEELRVVARRVHQANLELRGLVIALAGPAKAVLEQVDQWAEERGMVPVPQPLVPLPLSPTTGLEGAPHWDGRSTPSNEVIAGWAAERDSGVKAWEIADRYGVPAMRIVMYVTHWRKRQGEAVQLHSEGGVILPVDDGRCKSCSDAPFSGLDHQH